MFCRPVCAKLVEKARLLWAFLIHFDDCFRAARMLVKVLPASGSLRLGWNVCFCFFQLLTLRTSINTTNAMIRKMIAMMRRP
jgi:hypothetical protein